MTHHLARRIAVVLITGLVTIVLFASLHLPGLGGHHDPNVEPEQELQKVQQQLEQMLRPGATLALLVSQKEIGPERFDDLTRLATANSQGPIRLSLLEGGEPRLTAAGVEAPANTLILPTDQRRALAAEASAAQEVRFGPVVRVGDDSYFSALEPVAPAAGAADRVIESQIRLSSLLDTTHLPALVEEGDAVQLSLTGSDGQTLHLVGEPGAETLGGDRAETTVAGTTATLAIRNNARSAIAPNAIAIALLTIGVFLYVLLLLVRASTVAVENEIHFQRLADGARVMLIIARDDKILYTNPQAEHYTGYPPSALIGNSLDQLAPILGQHFVNEFRSTAPGPAHEVEIQGPDGKTRCVHYSVDNINYSGQEAKLARVFDVTAQRRLAERESEERARLEVQVAEQTRALRESNAELGRALRTKDEFLARMSHELRTPLSAIIGLTEVLLEQIRGPLNERQQKSLRTIEDSGRHLLSLINDILDLTKFEAGKLTVYREPVSIADVCESSLRFVKQSATRKNLTLHLDCEVGRASVKADVRRLKQILVNLLSNAVKFTPERGEVGLRVTLDPQEQRMIFSVWDTGVGIHKDDLTRLFAPFVQVDNSLTREYDGTGLGLALVARLINLHGGSVSVESTPGEGTRFDVTLPWSPEETEEPTQRLRPPSLVKPAIRRVHMIEYIGSSRDRLREMLAPYAVEVTVGSRDGDPLEQLRAGRPDLLILDVSLPDLRGWELMGRIRSSEDLQRLSVVVTSLTDQRARASTLGAWRHLLKPVTELHVQQIMESAGRSDQEELALPWSRVNPQDDRPLVLLLDDDEIVADQIGADLEGAGYQFAVARTIGAILNIMQTTTPALLLIDLEVGDRRPIDHFCKVAAISELRHLPMVVLATVCFPDDAQRFREEGAVAYLRKPVNRPALFRTIESISGPTERSVLVPTNGHKAYPLTPTTQPGA